MLHTKNKKHVPFALPHPWGNLSIRYKLGFSFALFIFILAALLLSMRAQSEFVLQSTYVQQSDYYNTNEFQNTLLHADVALEEYLKSSISQSTYHTQWQTAHKNMTSQLSNLSTDLNEVSVERYLLSVALCNGFEPYTEQCNALFTLHTNGASSAALYAQLETIQKTSAYLLDTVRSLQNQALNEGKLNLIDLNTKNEAQNNLYTVLSLAAILLLIALASELIHSIVVPVLRFAQASEAIRDGNFDTPDIIAINHDELFTLAVAFNEMKHNMKRMFETMREKTEIEAKLYQKELESRENSRLLAQAQMQQLRNQINPHFLFNTLNIISRTARSEKAKKSEKLIIALSRLFRYSLKTDDEEVPLVREINIVNDYISIQTTRFEQRVQLLWKISPSIDPERLTVPSFIFQPLVENAVIHGLEPKREGGIIRIRVSYQHDTVHFFITDNGVGMNQETISHLLTQTAVKGDVSGIGVGNVRNRLALLYPNATFRIRSRIGFGTSIQLSLPCETVKNKSFLQSQCAESTPTVPTTEQAVFS